jgi:hypothetical protein
VAWPAAIHPVWLGVAAALVSAMATAGFADSLDERAKRSAVCPSCRNVAAEQPRQAASTTGLEVVPRPPQPRRRPCDHPSGRGPTG